MSILFCKALISVCLQRPGRGVFLSLIALCLSLGFCLPVLAQYFEPFYQNNQHPFVQAFNLPAAESGRVVMPGQYKLLWQLGITNNAKQQSSGQEILVLDGETVRLSLAWRYGLKNGLELGLDVPLIWHYRGVLDQAIRNWHDLFGLSERPFRDNQLQYSYQGNNQVQISVDSSTAGLGDFRILVSWPLFQLPQQALALRAGLKLPSGRAESLLGSGSTDLSLALAYNKGSLPGGIAVNAMAGIVHLGDGELLPLQVREFIYYGSLSSAMQIVPDWQLKVQLDMHTSLFVSDLETLGGNAVQLTIGTTWQWHDYAQIDMGLSENIFTNVTPDVVFFTALRQYF